jgi:acetyltransferase-like isoleucine patch superfamily enzyme
MNSIMKRIIIFVFTKLYLIKYFLLLGSRIRLINTYIWNCKMIIDKSCLLLVSNTYLSKNKFYIKGHNNKVICRGGEIYNCLFSIEGQSNCIIIGSDVKLFNTNIKIYADSNTTVIGKGTRIGSATIVSMGKKNDLEIGEDCMIADQVDIWNTDSHPIYSIENNALLNMSKPIMIGNKVWIGKNVAILKGAKIGDGAIVGMRSVVTSEIKPNTLNVGLPARVIKEKVYWVRKYIDK